MNPAIVPETFEALRRLDACAIANAIESYGRRLRNEGFTDARIRCFFPGLPLAVGRAVTLRIRCSSPPTEGGHYLDRTDWWDFIETIASPRLVVIEDVDESPGSGSLLGEVHATILRALGCVGAVTNGAVRDLRALLSMGFPVFAGNVAVSHAYAHIVGIGGEVNVAGLRVRPGDLLAGDVHGVIAVPEDLAPLLPDRSAELVRRERRLLAVCRSSEFSPARLRETIRSLHEDRETVD